MAAGIRGRARVRSTSWSRARPTQAAFRSSCARARVAARAGVGALRRSPVSSRSCLDSAPCRGCLSAGQRGFPPRPREQAIERGGGKGREKEFRQKRGIQWPRKAVRWLCCARRLWRPAPAGHRTPPFLAPCSRTAPSPDRGRRPLRRPRGGVEPEQRPRPGASAGDLRSGFGVWAGLERDRKGLERDRKGGPSPAPPRDCPEFAHAQTPGKRGGGGLLILSSVRTPLSAPARTELSHSGAQVRQEDIGRAGLAFTSPHADRPGAGTKRPAGGKRKGSTGRRRGQSKPRVWRGCGWPGLAGPGRAGTQGGPACSD